METVFQETVSDELLVLVAVRPVGAESATAFAVVAVTVEEAEPAAFVAVTWN